MIPYSTLVPDSKPHVRSVERVQCCTIRRIKTANELFARGGRHQSSIPERRESPALCGEARLLGDCWPGVPLGEI